MSFDEIRLPEDIERGARGGPEFNTSVQILASGHESRNQNWARALYQWDIGYGIQDREGYIRILSFFLARRGRARGFRFKDWTDYEVDNELFGVGDGVSNEYQLSKTYTDIQNAYTRDIVKPINGTIRIFNNGVEVPTTDYTIDYITGIVTFLERDADAMAMPPDPGATLPALNDLLSWTGEYDIPVRFNTDDLNINLEWLEAGAIPNILIRELRL